MAPFKNETAATEQLNRLDVFISTLPQKEQDMVYTLIDELKKLPHTKSLTKKLDDAGIFEARGATADKWIRLFWFWHKAPGENSRIVITHGYLKDQNKTDPGEIKIAKDIKKRYESMKAELYRNEKKKQ
jgi:phage-related protein